MINIEKWPIMTTVESRHPTQKLLICHQYFAEKVAEIKAVIFGSSEKIYCEDENDLRFVNFPFTNTVMDEYCQKLGLS